MEEKPRTSSRATLQAHCHGLKPVQPATGRPSSQLSKVQSPFLAYRSWSKPGLACHTCPRVLKLCALEVGVPRSRWSGSTSAFLAKRSWSKPGLATPLTIWEENQGLLPRPYSEHTAKAITIFGRQNPGQSQGCCVGLSTPAQGTPCPLTRVK